MLIQRLLRCDKCQCDFELKCLWLDGSAKLMLVLQCQNCGKDEVIVESLRKMFKDSQKEFYGG